jgi:hypothetical protein
MDELNDERFSQLPQVNGPGDTSNFGKCDDKGKACKDKLDMNLYEKEFALF